MVDKDRQNSSASNASKRERISRKITRIVDDLPLFPTDINQLLAAAVKPVEDGTELLRLIESDPRLRSQLLALASSYFGREEDFKSIEDAVQHMGVRSLVQLIGISFARDVIQREFAALKYLNDYIDHGEDIYIASDILGGICSLPREQRQIHALAGLVHDVGRLAIMIAGNETGARVLGNLVGQNGFGRSPGESGIGDGPLRRRGENLPEMEFFAGHPGSRSQAPLADNERRLQLRRCPYISFPFRFGQRPQR